MRYLSIIFLVFYTLGCQKQSEYNAENKKESLVPNSGIEIGSRSIIDQVGGSNYLSKVKEYYVVINSDTSQYAPIFKKSKKDGSVSLDLNIPYSSNSLTHNERIDQLKLIIPFASKDFNFDSLQGIYVGRLLQTGHLSLAITNEYLEVFGSYKGIRTTDYAEISDFLLESRLASDFNNLFNPYNLLVEEVNIEKAFFASKESFRSLNTIEVDSSAVPEKILDCITWIKLRKKEM